MRKFFMFPVLFFTLLASAQTTFQSQVVLPAAATVSLDQLTQLTDGSFISVGIYSSTTKGLFVAKLDGSGNFLSGRTVVISNGFAYNSAVTSTSDGGFAIYSLVGLQTMCLMKFNAGLTLQWSKNYTTPTNFTTNNNAAKLVQTADGYYLMAVGVFKGNGYNGPNTGLLKTDSTGKVVFLKTYFSSTFSSIYDIKATADSNYVFLSRIDSFSRKPINQNCVTKISPAGMPIWSKATTTGDQSTTGSSLMVTSAGDIVVGGATLKKSLQYNGDDYEYVYREQMLLTKYSASGNLIWSERTALADNADTHTLFMKEDSQGNYMLAGYVNQFQNTFSKEIYSFRMNFDTAGHWQWTKRKGEQSTYQNMRYMSAAQDGSFIMGGNGYYNSTSSLFFAKFGGDGETCGTGTTDTAETIDTLGGAAVQPTIVTDVAVTASDATVTIDSAGSGTVICTGVLPVKLLSFTASANHKQADVSWTTANEVNADYYTVERSANGTAFTTLKTVAAKGNGAGTQTYTITDASPLPGTSYYRLKESDKDGTETRSSIVPVVFGTAASFMVSPNPVAGSIRILLQSSTAGKAVMEVNDMAGRLLLTQTAMVNEGMNTITLPASSLHSGMYILKMIQNNKVQSVRFVKE